MCVGDDDVIDADYYSFEMYNTNNLLELSIFCPVYCIHNLLKMMMSLQLLLLCLVHIHQHWSNIVLHSIGRYTYLGCMLILII